MKRFARLARLKMMTPTSLLRMSVVALVVTVVLAMAGGCRKASTSFNQPPPSQPPPAVQPATESPAVENAETHTAARRTVIEYIRALRNGKFNAAYEMLSRDSQKLHSISDFEQHGRQGMPPFDLDSAKIIASGEDVVVEVSFIEDPGSHGFHLVREDKNWKIVYRGGSPVSPDPRMPSGGWQKGDTQ